MAQVLSSLICPHFVFFGSVVVFPRPHNTKNPQKYTFPAKCRKRGGSFLTYRWSFFCVQLSFFAYSPLLRPFLDVLSAVSKEAPTVSKNAETVSKKAPTVSKRAEIVNCKQKSSTVSRKLPTVSKKAASKKRGDKRGGEEGKLGERGDRV